MDLAKIFPVFGFEDNPDVEEIRGKLDLFVNHVFLPERGYVLNVRKKNSVIELSSENVVPLLEEEPKIYHIGKDNGYSEVDYYKSLKEDLVTMHIQIDRDWFKLKDAFRLPSEGEIVDGFDKIYMNSSELDDKTRFYSQDFFNITTVRTYPADFYGAHSKVLVSSEEFLNK